MSFRPTDEDEKLWDFVTKGARRFLENKGFPKANAENKEAGLAVPPADRQKVPPPSVKAQSEQEPQLNRRDQERLRKGQMEIEASLDLHGLRQEEAREALKRFILTASARQMRCVIVVTGKGTLSKPSILRQNLPDWLREAPLRNFVLQFTEAQPKDGGGGAFYVYLKRQKG